MLADTERKLLRVLYNYVRQHNVIPTMGDLERLMGRNKKGLEESLMTLENLNYIYWENKASLASIQIIQGWERGESKTVVSSASKESINYWMEF
ncbi:hypothetical protein J2T13_002028 [Paenibacillus sp. DS2015]|uniref:hypothetical protein n=1 Tax=Paenibacillus sp. DS2015 TaxID=3373917 RepID=UPI003D1D814F